MIELKPCPFCGGKAFLADEFTNFLVKINYVICPDCQCRGASKRKEEEAIKAWNRRADDG